MKKHFYFLCAIASLFTIYSCTNDVSEDFISQKKVKLTQDEALLASPMMKQKIWKRKLFSTW